MTNREKYINQATDEEIVAFIKDICTQTNCAYNGAICSKNFCSVHLYNWLRQEAPHDKTYAEDFFEKFPDAKCNINDYEKSKIPAICIKTLYGSTKFNYDCMQTNCIKCWTQPMKKEENDVSRNN